jgi:pimeloyl-ACP methyl ester carboxylesterase
MPKPADSAGPLRPFRLAVSEEELVDLGRRLAAVRWPPAAPGGAWRWGTDLIFLQKLVHRWREGFDWRQWEALLGMHEQSLVTLGGGDVHVLVARGSGDNPLPIILSHGWPGSVFELIGLVEPLAHPERFGGSARDAFTVVLPSLPGFGFSGPPASILSPRDVAAMWHTLMHDVLGFSHYVAHGGDIGASIASWLGLDHAEACSAIHITAATMQAPWTLAEQKMTDEEEAWRARADCRRRGEQAYQRIHGEKPATLAVALADSPVGLAAWIIEKFHGWNAPNAPPLPNDALIANVLAYWFGNSHPVHWMYQSLLDSSGYVAPEGRRVEAPTGLCLFPDDISVPPPQSWLARGYNVSRVTRAPTGGHFPGIENPEFLSSDIREFFRTFRG